MNADKTADTCFFACSADSQNRIAETLGTSEFLMFFSKGGAFTETIKCDRPLPILLKQYHVHILFCGGIGNCVNSLLESQEIEVIAGCSGDCAEVLQKWKDGTLKRDIHYACSDHGRTCGSCPGKF